MTTYKIQVEYFRPNARQPREDGDGGGWGRVARTETACKASLARGRALVAVKADPRFADCHSFGVCAIKRACV